MCSAGHLFYQARLIFCHTLPLSMSKAEKGQKPITISSLPKTCPDLSQFRVCACYVAWGKGPCAFTDHSPGRRYFPWVPESQLLHFPHLHGGVWGGWSGGSWMYCHTWTTATGECIGMRCLTFLAKDVSCGYVDFHNTYTVTRTQQVVFILPRLRAGCDSPAFRTSSGITEHQSKKSLAKRQKVDKEKF